MKILMILIHRCCQVCVQSVKQSLERTIQYTSYIRLDGLTFTPGLLQPNSRDFIQLKLEIERVVRCCDVSLIFFVKNCAKAGGRGQVQKGLKPSTPLSRFCCTN